MALAGDRKMICRPHWERARVRITANRVIAGTPMCDDCFFGRSDHKEKRIVPLKVRPRMSAASKKAWADPEVRARMSAARKKAWADPEVRARMSAASKKAWADPEVRARMTAASKKAWADPEVRARMTAASKRYHRAVKFAWMSLTPEKRAEILKETA
ncbi:MAG: hypothetical protein ACRD4V_07660 [Candidatus Acidiferrales bacterium]